MATAANNFTDYYALLQVATDADGRQIRLAYIKQAKTHHPDAGGTTDGMKLLNVAYKTLTNESIKTTYDQLHSFHTGTPQSRYVYQTGRAINNDNDMSDAEIDNFLDSLLKEYSEKPPKPSVRQRLKQFFGTK